MAKSESEPKSSGTVAASAPPGGDDDFVVLAERLRRVALGLLALLIASRPYWPSEDSNGIPGLTWTFAVLLTLVLTALSWIVGGSIRYRFAWADAAVLGMAILIGLSAHRAPDRRAAINAAWNVCGAALLYIAARVLPRTREESMALADILLASAVAVSAYGVYQVTVEYPEMRRYYQTHKPQVLRTLGIPPNSAQEFLYEQRLNSNEPMSTFALANSLAGFIVGPLVLALAIIAQSAARYLARRNRETGGSVFTAIILAMFPLAPIVVCLLLTKSRSAWIGLAVGLIPVGVRLARKTSKRFLLVAGPAFAAAVAALAIAGAVTGKLDKQVLLESTKSLRYRFEYWTGAWRLIKESSGNFWLGYGPGNFGKGYLLHKLETASEDVKDPHNLVLETWAGSGLPAAVCLFAALGLGTAAILKAPDERAGQAGLDPDFDPMPLSRSSRRRLKAGKGDPSAPPNSPFWLYVCGAASWLAVVLLGWFNPIDVSTSSSSARWYLLGLAWCLALFFGRPIRQWAGGLPSVGFAGGAIAISVNLLAAGGIGMPAVAMSLWLLIAAGLNLGDERGAGRLSSIESRWKAFLVAAAIAGLTGIFLGAVGRYWLAQTAIQRAESELLAPSPNFDKARNAYLKAISQDAYGSDAWLGLAELEYRYWLSRGGKASEDIWKRIDVALLEGLHSPRTATSLDIQRRRAMYAREILARGASELTPAEIIKLRASIVNALRNAALLHPTNAMLHAELAEASADLGEYAGAIREAREALRLDSVTPHIDRKLFPAVRDRLKKSLPVWRVQMETYQKTEVGGKREK